MSIAAQLNLMAGNHARSAAAFDVAFRYLSTGLGLLPGDSWQTDYMITFELYKASAEVAVLNGDLDQAVRLALIAEEHAQTTLQKAEIMKIRMDVYMIQTQLKKVIETGLSVIKMLEFDLEEEIKPVQIDEQILQLPEMTDPRALVVSELAQSMLSAAFASNDPRYIQIILFFIHLYAQYGNSSGAGYTYINYAVVLLSQFKEMELGCRLGKIALQLAEKGGTSPTLFSVRYVYFAFIFHWVGHAREALVPLYENTLPACQSGNIRFALNLLDMEAQNSLFVGLPLEQVQSKQAEAVRKFKPFEPMVYTQRLRIWAQVAINLMGDAVEPNELNGELFSEAEAQDLKEAGQNLHYLFHLYVAQAFLHLLFREPRRALEAFSAANAIMESGRTQLITPHFCFYYSLALLSPELDSRTLPQRLEKVEENLNLMRLWTNLVPENFQHQVELVEAELARCMGQDDEVVKHYDQAIVHARTNGYIHESAIAAELAAEYFLDHLETLAAIPYLHTAYSSYLAWGAMAKVKDLEDRYPEWLPPQRDDEKLERFPHPQEEEVIEPMTSSIDLNTILKASLELAHETDLNILLRRLISILIENAGAQRGALILLRDDQWFLEVLGSIEPEDDFRLPSIPLENQDKLVGEPCVPISLIYFVINAQADLLLEDASVSYQFSQDTYIEKRRPKSILCSPLLNQGELYGVVYLENNLTAGTFTSDRLEVVKLIAGQAAVSIENARLYENMEALVEERTHALSEANKLLQEEIEERARAEEALRLSEERYRTVFESTGTAMAVIDENGYILLANEKYVQLSGYSRTELENHFHSRELVAPTDLHRDQDLRQAAFAHTAGIPNSFEFQMINKTGEEKAVLATTSYLPRSKAIIASLIDISQRKSAEEAVRYNEALLRKVLEIFPVGVWIINKDSMIISGNPEGERIWGGIKFFKMQEYGEYRAWRADTGERIQAEDWAARLALTDLQVTLKRNWRSKHLMAPAGQFSILRYLLYWKRMVWLVQSVSTRISPGGNKTKKSSTKPMRGYPRCWMFHS